MMFFSPSFHATRRGSFEGGTAARIPEASGSGVTIFQPREASPSFKSSLIGEDAIPDDLDADLAKQVERSGEPENRGDGKRSRLVTPSGKLELSGVVKILPLLLEVPPASERGRQALARVFGDIEDRASFRAQKPLVRIGHEHVDLEVGGH